MNTDRFGALPAFLTVAPSRRVALRLLGGLGLAGLVAQTDARKQKKCARAGQATSKKRKKCCSGLARDATGRCAAPARGCTPAGCLPSACGTQPDGCGGTLSCGGCAGNSLCHDGVCRLCDVTCPSGSGAEDCGADLDAVLGDAGAGDTIFVCPGRYRNTYTIDTAIHVIGAGDGPVSTSNTILDADGTGRVLQIPFGTAGLVELERLRITGGSVEQGTGSGESGAGILHQGATLRMTACTVNGNTADGGNSLGGGILVASGATLEMLHCTVRANHATTGAAGGGFFSSGTLTLTDCLIEENDADSLGGGLWVNGGKTTLIGSTQVRDNDANQGGGMYISAGTLEIAETCRVTENRADAVGNGGGIFRFGGTVTLQGPDLSPIVIDNCEENCAPLNSVAWCSPDLPVSCPP
jgi:hypothetical protein